MPGSTRYRQSLVKSSQQHIFCICYINTLLPTNSDREGKCRFDRMPSRSTESKDRSYCKDDRLSRIMNMANDKRDSQCRHSFEVDSHGRRVALPASRRVLARNRHRRDISRDHARCENRVGFVSASIERYYSASKLRLRGSINERNLKRVLLNVPKCL